LVVSVGAAVVVAPVVALVVVGAAVVAPVVVVLVVPQPAKTDTAMTAISRMAAKCLTFLMICLL
jgi:hypothetical protein